MKPNVRIIGTGSYTPKQIISNLELEEAGIGTTAKWIEEKLGIQERRIADPNEATSDLCLKAADMALISAGIPATDLDLIIVATITPDRPAPSTACVLQRHLGARDIPAFDLAAVCSGFLFAMITGAQYVETGFFKTVLVVGGDTFSRITNWRRRDCVFFGDGAGAVILQATDLRYGIGMLSIDMHSDGNDDNAFYVAEGGSAAPFGSVVFPTENTGTWVMDGKAVFKKAIDVLPRSIVKAVADAKLSLADIKWIIPHQPSIRILQNVSQTLQIPFEKVLHNMERYANTGAATIPILLDETVRAGRIHDNDIIVFTAIGAGWTWGSVVFKWS